MLSRYVRPSTVSGPLPAIKTNAAERSSDLLFIRRIANGDKLAMHALFAKYRTQVYRWLLRFVGNEAQAEDILSEVFLDDPATLRAWLLNDVVVRKGGRNDQKRKSGTGQNCSHKMSPYS